MNRITEHAFLSYAFRPMFLGLGIFAVVAMTMWIATLAGIAQMPKIYGPLWHGHEMLFGFGLAAVAGFLLTAVATWTGRPPLQGGPLMTLAAGWLIGRVVLASGLPASSWSAALAMVFPVLLAVLIAREIVRGGSRRNYPIVAIVALLALLDGLYHAGALGVLPGMERLALLAALYLMIVLVAVVAGRIIPIFTGNWLRTRGIARLPLSIHWVERLTVPVTALTGVLALALPAHAATGMAAALASFLHTVRLLQWRGLSTVSEPIVFILHVAYAWLPVGFALMSASIFTEVIPHSSVLHAFAVGAIGTMILAVTTRVALGHTDRPLRATSMTVVGYVALTVSAAARVVSPFAENHYLASVEIAAFAWIGAWSLFLWTYASILIRSRVTEQA